jgi:hypothetical protein
MQTQVFTYHHKILITNSKDGIQADAMSRRVLPPATISEPQPLGRDNSNLCTFAEADILDFEISLAFWLTKPRHLWAKTGETAGTASLGPSQYRLHTYPDWLAVALLR